MIDNPIPYKEEFRYAHHEDLEKVRDSLNEFVVMMTKSQAQSDEFKKSATEMMELFSIQLKDVQQILQNFQAILKVSTKIFSWILGIGGALTTILLSVIIGNMSQYLQ